MARGTSSGRGNLWQTTGLVLLAALTVGLCFLALSRDVSSNAVVSDTAAEPSDGSSSSQAPPEPSEPAEPAPPALDVPDVKNLRNADFAGGDDLPDGSRTFDNPAVGGPMELADGGLTHGAPTAREAISSLETKLGGPVQKLSARVVFSGDAPGSVVLVAWRESLVNARTADQPVPQSGLRLVASAGSWQLTTYEGQPTVLQEGTYEAVEGPATFTVTRQGDVAWVQDPTGAVTQVQSPLIESLAGPWACWQLYEKSGAETPAVIEAVSAG